MLRSSTPESSGTLSTNMMSLILSMILLTPAVFAAQLFPEQTFPFPHPAPIPPIVPLPLPVPNINAASVVTSIAVANNVDPLVTGFAIGFVNSFKKPIEYLFDTSVANEIAVALYMNKGTREALAVNYDDPARAALMLTEGVQATFGFITPQQYAAAYGFTNGQILLNGGYLNQFNNTAQGQQYAKLKEDYITKFPIEPHFEAIEDACVDFLVNYDLFNAGNIVDQNAVFRHYMYISAGLQSPNN